MDRRTFVAVVGSSAVTLAGCSGNGENSQSNETETDGTDEEQSDEGSESGGSVYELEGELNASGPYISVSDVEGQLRGDSLEYGATFENGGQDEIQVQITDADLLADDGSEVASTTITGDNNVSVSPEEPETHEAAVDFSEEEFDAETVSSFSMFAQTF